MAERFRLGDVLRVVVPLLILVGFTVLWELTPVGEDARTLSSLAAEIRGWPLAPLAAVGAFVAGGLVAAPLTAMVLATVLTFGPVHGGLYAMAGTLGSGLTNFALGRSLGRAAVERLLGEGARRIQRWLETRGLPALVIIRNAPVAPYAIVNVVAGASGLALRDFVIGTVIGVLPEIVAVSVFGEAMVRFVVHPTPGRVAIVVVLVAVLTGVSVLLGRWLVRHEERGGSEGEEEHKPKIPQ